MFPAQYQPIPTKPFTLLDYWVVRDSRGMFLCTDGLWRNQEMTSMCPSCWMKLYKRCGCAKNYAITHFIKDWEVMRLSVAMTNYCGISLETDKGGG